ncbi:winged helix-turn-helix transcriptional regulator [Allonocardiopsis opalescens]|uniref:HxlR family transcriptional regulator n=1 Tax=Allonocardiopsis opalescens TaxID=1144618 RepID=A0A2T0Q4C6_9ACTN|nr:helix-turn-helix domain-containing protein [Allonocardiopsis opalescens]PRX98665.1 HxlR family transcriptional regulator [Allonocardiopsis opalescens]
MGEPSEGHPGHDAAVCAYFHAAVELIGRRWNGAVLQSLSAGPLRYRELKRRIPEVGDTMLSQRLRELEAEGLLVREVDAGPPVRVSYALTPKGAALAPVLAAITAWGHEWLRTGAAADNGSAADGGS